MIKNNLLRVRVKESFPALKYRNFRYFFTGQSISLIGTWMQNIAQPWLVLSLTDSPLLLGLVVTFQTLPQMIFSLFIGPFIDQLPKKKILIFTQTLFMILAAVLGILTIISKVKYWHVLVIALIFGFLNTIDMPTRQSYMVELVGKDDLMNAIALNSSIFNLARIIGPAIGGILIGLVGTGPCFLINAISYLAVIFQLTKITVIGINPNTQLNMRLKQLYRDVVYGIKYIFSNERMRIAVILLFILSIFCLNFSIMIPVFAQNFLKSESRDFGILMSAMGVGALFGALFVAISKTTKPKLSTMIISSIGLSIGELLMYFASNIYIAFTLLVFIGLFMILFTTSVNSTLQLESDDNVRGRVMSVYSFVFVGVAPIGSMYAGALLNKLNANIAFSICGFIGIIGVMISIYFLLWRNNRNTAYKNT